MYRAGGTNGAEDTYGIVSLFVRGDGDVVKERDAIAVGPRMQSGDGKEQHGKRCEEEAAHRKLPPENRLEPPGQNYQTDT